MVRVKLIAFALAGASLAGLGACNKPAANTTVAETTSTAPTESSAKLLTANATDADKIASAMTAAPKAIADGATIIDMGPGGMRELRKGTNGFTCMADAPATPGPDPMCADASAMGWIDAWSNKKPVPKGKAGVMYMLAGGTDASNTDPYATAPTSGNNWIKTGPHLMIVGSPEILAAYPRDANPDAAKPYVMWSGTPYEHLMVPIG
jgi:hypothetical protein